MFNNMTKIEEIQKEAHQTNVANKILEKLEKLRLSSNNNNSRRWIWELIQNAKDVVNSNSKINIQIFFDEKGNTLEFKHNGKPFSTENLVYLIEQVSTKERTFNEQTKDRKIGKFGTGFLTTHLLSTKVTVSGILLDDDIPMSFSVLLDRSGTTKEDVLNAINKTYTELNDSLKDSEFTKNDFNTSFKYNLDAKGLEVARQGLIDLEVSIPYVLALIPEIESVSVEPNGIVYQVCKRIPSHLESAEVIHIIKKSFQQETDTFLFKLSENDVEIIIPVVEEAHKKYCTKTPLKLPRLFCNFPLIGTDDFPFPVVINSPKFNPTEPRDGIFLTNNDDKKIDDNKKIINTACSLYQKFLNYASNMEWQQLFNAIKINDTPTKDWLSKEWVDENVITVCRNIIKYTPLIDTYGGKRITLFNSKSDQQVFIPKADDREKREAIWNFTKELSYGYLPNLNDVNEWYDALWSDCRNLSLEDLVKYISDMGNIETLSTKLAHLSVTNYLSNLYKLISKDEKLLDAVHKDEILIVPNQKGVFYPFSNLSIDMNIDEEYKNVILLLAEDFRERLIYKELDVSPLKAMRKISVNDIIESIKIALGSDNGGFNFYSACFSILAMYENEVDKRVNSIYKIVSKLYRNNQNLNVKRVSYFSNELFEKALRKVCNLIVEEISQKKNISCLAEFAALTSSETKLLLSELIDFLRIQKFDHYFERKNSILPNQHGEFIPKDNLFLDNGIDEVIKDLSEIAGEDAREYLLDPLIPLEFPANRTKQDRDFSLRIERFAKDNYRKDRQDNSTLKTFYSQLFLWMKDNEEKGKTLFPELSENIHWLYDDNEIANNMHKAKAVDKIMNQLGINNLEELKSMVSSLTRLSDSTASSKEEITEKMLIQSGIGSQDALNSAFSNELFASEFRRDSTHTVSRFEYVNKIIKRAKENIINYLSSCSEYDLSNITQIAETIFIIKRNDVEIYLIARPSDGGEVRLYYDTEKDMLDYSKDWELWVEDGKNIPEKISFGKIIKLTGINRIPLRRL